MPSFCISKSILEEINLHAEKEYPSECCGWILKLGDERLKYIPSENLQDKYHALDPGLYPRTSKDAFLVNTLKLSKDIKAVSHEGGGLFSIVHSHIDVGAYFSNEDKKQMAEPDMSTSIFSSECYLVVSVNKGIASDKAVFYFDKNKKDFLSADLILIA